MIRRPFLFYPLGIIVIHLIITVPILAWSIGTEFDETLYHYPTVLLIRAHWPEIDFNRDVLSAVSPGYHYFLATVSLFIGPGLVSLRIVNDFVSVLVPLTLFYWLARWVSPARAFWLVLPVLLSSHFIKGSCRVMTDNVSILFIAFTLASIFLLPARGFPGLVGGIAATVAASVRQLTVWLEVPLLVQLFLEWIYPRKNANPAPRPDLRDLLILGVRLLPLAVVAFLYSQWHGLVPPAWQSSLVTLSAAPSAFILSLTALFGTPLLLSLGPLLKHDLVFSRFTALAALIGLVLASLSPNFWSFDQGRWGGSLWSIVSRLPVIDGRSIFFFVVSPIGAAVLSIFFRLVSQNASLPTALLWISCVLGWMVTYFASAQIFQRYFEVQLLIFLVVAFALIIAPHPTWRPRRWPLALLGIYFLATLGGEIYLPMIAGAHSIESLRQLEGGKNGFIHQDQHQ